MRDSGSRSKSKQMVVEPNAIVAIETMMLKTDAALLWLEKIKKA